MAYLVGNIRPGTFDFQPVWQQVRLAHRQLRVTPALQLVVISLIVNSTYVSQFHTLYHPLMTTATVPPHRWGKHVVACMLRSMPSDGKSSHLQVFGNRLYKLVLFDTPNCNSVCDIPNANPIELPDEVVRYSVVSVDAEISPQMVSTCASA